MFTGDDAYPLSFGVNADVLEAFGIVPLSVRKYGDTWKLHTETGDLALRSVVCAPDQLQAAFETAEYLSSQGFAEDGWRFVRSRCNDPFVRDGSRLFYLTAWVPGTPVDVTQSSHLDGVVRTLADWHHAVHGAPLGRPRGDGFRAWFDCGRSAVTQLATQVNADSASAVWLAEALDGLVRELHDIKERLDAVSWWDRDQAARSEGWICLGQMDRRHVRYDGERYRLFNYEHVGNGHPFTDLARLLQDIMPIHDWNAEGLSKLVEAYCTRWQEDDDGPALMEALLQVPFLVLENVQRVPPDEGQLEELSDLLEYELFHAEAKRRAIRALAANRDRRQAAPADIVYAELNEPGAVDTRGIGVAGIQRGTSKSAARRKLQKITIHRYQPKGDAPVQSTGPAGLHLFNDAQRPE